MASSGLVSLLGEKVINGDHEEVSVESISQKKGAVGIYFSAHWCPPCRGFTPVLGDFYEAVKDARQDNFEVVFVSSDRADEDFKGYFGEMPWLAVPFADRETKKKLSEKYGVTGIPTLIVVNAETGETLDMNGRATVASGNGKFADKWRQ